MCDAVVSRFEHQSESASETRVENLYRDGVDGSEEDKADRETPYEEVQA